MYLQNMNNDLYISLTTSYYRRQALSKVIMKKAF